MIYKHHLISRALLFGLILSVVGACQPTQQPSPVAIEGPNLQLNGPFDLGESPKGIGS